MKIVISEDQLKKIIQSQKDEIIHCSKCGWEWKKSEGGDDVNTCHKCGHVNNISEDDDSKVNLGLTDKQVKSIDDLNKDAKFLKCKACKKLYTQTTYKKKKSLPICPWCGKHN